MSSTEKKSDNKRKVDPSLEELQVGSVNYRTRLTSKFRKRKNWERPDERLVLAYIPGTIQKIMVKEGAEVTQGTPLLILEAMKMSNEILSPGEGVVKKIHVSEGDMVPKAQLLVEFK